MVPVFCPVKVRVDVESVATTPVPVPVKLAVCVVPVEELSVTVSMAVRVLMAEGVNVTLIVQVVLLAARDVPQLLVWPKSPLLVPLSAMLLMVIAPVPVFLRVRAWLLLVVFTVWLVKVSDVGVSDAVGAVPVPVNETVCGLPVALSTIESEAVRVPVAVGLNVMVTAHEDPVETDEPHVFDEMAKSPLLVPVRVSLVRVSVPVPVLLMVTLWPELVVPVFCPVNVRVVAESSEVPVPVRVTACGDVVELSVMVNVVERDPVPVGLNVMV